MQSLKNQLLSGKITLRNKALRNILRNLQKSLGHLNRKNFMLQQTKKIQNSLFILFKNKCEEGLFNLIVTEFREIARG